MAGLAAARPAPDAGVDRLLAWAVAQRRYVPFYIALIVGSEVVTALVGTVPGALCHALVLLALFNHYLVVGRRPPIRTGAPAVVSAARYPARALAALALVPLLRLFTLALALDQPRLYAYAAVGAPMFLVALLAIEKLGLADVMPGRGGRLGGGQASVALAGAPLGLLAFILLRPEPLAGGPTWDTLLAGSVVLFVFGGVLEELVFRGVVQRALADVFPRGAFIASSVLYAGASLGTGSARYVTFVAVVGLLFGAWVERTGSIVGVALAHGLLAIGLVVVWPFIL